jgi:hypothetical protein
LGDDAGVGDFGGGVGFLLRSIAPFLYREMGDRIMLELDAMG